MKERVYPIVYDPILIDDPDSKMLYDDGDDGWLGSVHHIVYISWFSV